MEISVYALPNTEKTHSQLDISQSVFDVDYNQDLVWQACVAYRAAGRSGSKATLSRAGVRGGGKKPWRQKGTGRARAGTSSSPIWVGGGMTFALAPRDFSQKINRKMYRAAMKSILSQLLREQRLMVIQDPKVLEAKTKQAIQLLGAAVNEKLLILTHEINVDLVLGVRNLFNVNYGLWRSVLNPVNLCAAKKVLITATALTEIQEWLQ